MLIKTILHADFWIDYNKSKVIYNENRICNKHILFAKTLNRQPFGGKCLLMGRNGRHGLAKVGEEVGNVLETDA